MYFPCVFKGFLPHQNSHSTDLKIFIGWEIRTGTYSIFGQVASKKNKPVKMWTRLVYLSNHTPVQCWPWLIKILFFILFSFFTFAVILFLLFKDTYFCGNVYLSVHLCASSSCGIALALGGGLETLPVVTVISLQRAFSNLSPRCSLRCLHVRLSTGLFWFFHAMQL